MRSVLTRLRVGALAAVLIALAVHAGPVGQGIRWIA